MRVYIDIRYLARSHLGLQQRSRGSAISVRNLGSAISDPTPWRARQSAHCRHCDLADWYGGAFEHVQNRTHQKSSWQKVRSSTDAEKEALEFRIAGGLEVVDTAASPEVDAWIAAAPWRHAAGP